MARKSGRLTHAMGSLHDLQLALRHVGLSSFPGSHETASHVGHRSGVSLAVPNGINSFSSFTGAGLLENMDM